MKGNQAVDNKVYLVKCPDYEHVNEKLAELMALMGGVSQFARAGEKIVLKVNLLQSATPEKAVTTHPAVVVAVGRMARQVGAVPIIADSPGAGLPYNQKTLERIYHTTGMVEAAETAGVEVNLDTTYQAVSFPQGNLIKRFEVISPVLTADGVFSLCKLKTHTFMSMTGAIKNNFGVIPGLTKPGYHANLQDKLHFAKMLLDLAAYVSPRLSIMDAVIGMEGNGPHTGTPRQIGWLLAATNPLALDVVAGEIIGLDRAQNPVLLAAEQQGLYPHRLEQVELIGADISDVRVPNFKLPSTVFDEAGLGPLTWLAPMLKKASSLQPHIIKDRCVACGSCYQACPVDAITMNGYAHINDKACIRCYCCHEMCPEEAVELRSSWLYRLVNRT
ncbi:MAG: DUF362 domain-containing protein [Anaerolineae bacterium]|nr:DUF362 domain-containing protein [Anaerolineae bacterium]